MTLRFWNHRELYGSFIRCLFASPCLGDQEKSLFGFQISRVYALWWREILLGCFAWYYHASPSENVVGFSCPSALKTMYSLCFKENNVLALFQNNHMSRIWWEEPSAYSKWNYYPYEPYEKYISLFHSFMQTVTAAEFFFWSRLFTSLVPLLSTTFRIRAAPINF